MRKSKPVFLFLFLFFTKISYSQNTLSFVSQKIEPAGHSSFYLKLPASYKIAIAAQGLHRPRFFSISPDGRLFVTDMYNRDDNKKGKIYILEGWNDTLRSLKR